MGILIYLFNISYTDDDSSSILLSMYKDIYKIKRRHTLTENANTHILRSLYIDARIGKDTSC